MKQLLRGCRFIFLAALALLAPTGCEPEKPGADEEAMRALFEEARKLDSEGRHHEALVRYETILGKHPTWMSTRLNAAMAAYDSGQYQKAIGHFELIHKYGPTDWFIVRKLIQCYERVGREDKVDEFRKKLTELRNRQDGSPLLKSYQGFTRDYIPVGTTMHLIGYEFFEPDKHGQFWLFKLEDLHRTPLSIFVIHSSPFHNGSGQRLFYLTEACPGWMRVWYVGPEGRNYDWARKQVTEILQSKHAPLMVKPVPLDLDLLNVPGGTSDKPTTENTQEPEPKK
jgi:tetratricopeptide (TPR) repeat protein